MKDKTQSNIPVANIAPCHEMVEHAREISSEFERPIMIEVSDLGEGLKKGQSLLDKGVEVITSQGQTVNLLKKEMHIPVVKMYIRFGKGKALYPRALTRAVSVERRR